MDDCCLPRAQGELFEVIGMWDSPSYCQVGNKYAYVPVHAVMSDEND